MRLTPIINLHTVWGLFRACLHRRRIAPAPGGLILNSVALLQPWKRRFYEILSCNITAGTDLSSGLVYLLNKFRSHFKIRFPPKLPTKRGWIGYTFIWCIEGHLSTLVSPRCGWSYIITIVTKCDVEGYDGDLATEHKGQPCFVLYGCVG